MPICSPIFCTLGPSTLTESPCLSLCAVRIGETIPKRELLIQDIDGARQAIVMLLNLVENLKQENEQLREENQKHRDENQRLKGEQGKPKIKGNRRSKKKIAQDHSSERERRRPKPRQKRSKVATIQIDREEVLEVEPEQLPADAKFKGYDAVVVQDLKVETDNIRFLKKKYHSLSEHKVYLAELPAGYQGEFGPGIKSLAITLYFGANMTEPKILEFFHNVGIQISSGQLSNFLIKDQADFHAEKDAIYEAGLHSSPWSTSMTLARESMVKISIATSSVIHSTPPISPLRRKTG